MGKVFIEDSVLMWMEKTIEELERKVKYPPVTLFSRQVQGVIANKTILTTSNINAYYFVEGMDMTVECDSNILLVDEIVTYSTSALTGSARLAIEVDGVVDSASFTTYNVVVSTAYQKYGHHVARVTPGRHQIRLMISTTTGVTVTLTDISRYMRVTGLVNPRKG